MIREETTECDTQKKQPSLLTEPLCPICIPAVMPDKRKYGLMWVGSKFYKTPEDFIAESQKLGISKRLGNGIPRGLKIGDFVLLGHREAVRTIDPNTKEEELRPGIFYGYHIRRFEIIITASQSKDEKFMEKIARRGLTPVVVPDDDKDHQGTVYDKKNKEE